MPPSFRFSASKVLLTYSQVCQNMTREAVLYSLEERYSIDTYVIGEENHADGGRHIHAALTFRRKVDSRDVKIFDINCGEDCSDHHPNIKPILRGQANLDRARDYCKKEDVAPLTNVEEKLTWHEIIQHSVNAADFLAEVKKHYPRDYCLHLKNYEYSAAKLFPSPTPDTIQTFQWNEVEAPPAWDQIENAIADWLPEAQALLLVGPGGCGKTTWAKMNAPKPALFVRHLDTLCQLTSEHRSIIFDDMDFQHLPVPTQKYLIDCRDVATIHVRYRTATIPVGVTRIFTSNVYPFQANGNHIQAIQRRIKLIDLY